MKKHHLGVTGSMDFQKRLLMSYASNDESISAHQKSLALRKNISKNVRKSLNNIDTYIYRRKPVLNLQEGTAVAPFLPTTAKAATRFKKLDSIDEFKILTARG